MPVRCDVPDFALTTLATLHSLCMNKSLKRLVSVAVAMLSCVFISVVAETRDVPSATAASTCATGGTCQLGDRAPDGSGIVFFVSPEPQWWGQYLASSSSYNSFGSGGVDWGGGVIQDKAGRIRGKEIGAGAENTRLLALQSPFHGFVLQNGFHVPSKDELDALYNYIATSKSPLSTAYNIGVDGSPYWTSSEASDAFAWYQLFQDGTQFTDANGIVPGLTANKMMTKSNAHKGSSFKPAPMRYALVKAFAPKGAVLPPRPAPPTIPAGGRSSASCSAGTACQVGDIGPGGGVVFFDAGTRQSWGRWLEAAPAACQKSGLKWRRTGEGTYGSRVLPLLYPTWESAARQRVESKRIGMGKTNTELIVKQQTLNRGQIRRMSREQQGLVNVTPVESTAAGYASSLVCGGKDDWFLPSKDELDALYNVLALTDNDLTGNNSFGFTRGFYWTSSEYNNETAWTQLWIDGQQFDREKWLNGDPRKDGGFNPFHVRPIRAFG